MNTMSRSRRYDEPKMPTRPRATTTPITMSIVRSGTSPSHMTARMPTTQIMAVPRSDWGPRMMSTGARTSRPTSAKNTNTVYCPSRKSVNRRAATSTSAIFANSEACRLAEPIMSHRRAFLIAHARHCRDHEQRERHGPDNPYRIAAPERDGHELPDDQSKDHARDGELDLVERLGHRIDRDLGAGFRQSDDRRGRVDHHEADEHEGEHRQQEDDPRSHDMRRRAALVTLNSHGGPRRPTRKPRRLRAF